eukprot:PhF_6_TR7342/c0_g1_i1/m.11034
MIHLFLVFFMLLCIGGAPAIQRYPIMDDKQCLLTFVSSLVRGPRWSPSAAVCTWEGITCNNQSIVTTIQFVETDYLGELTWNSCFPKNLTEIHISQNEIYGTPSFATLPTTIQRIVLSVNSFNGSISQVLGLNLPRSLQRIFLDNNKFTGSLSLGDLPPQLTMFDVSFNGLSGTILNQEDRLPSSLTYLAFSNNALSGSINGVLKALPASTIQMFAQFNLFDGTPELTALPEKIEFMVLHTNRFTGTPDFVHLPASLRYLDLSSNNMTGVPNFSNTPPKMWWFTLDGNTFNGNGTFRVNGTTGTRVDEWCTRHVQGGICTPQHCTFLQQSMCRDGITAKFDCLRG